MNFPASIVGLLSATAIFAAFAQTGPTKLLVGAPPGGGNDVVARIVTSRMNLAAPIVVENRPGAASMIAAEQVSRSPADGSVLLLVSQSVMSVSPRLQKTKTVDPMKDFVPVAFLAKAPLILVGGPSLKASSIQEVIKLAKSDPTALDFGSGGIGTSPHMAGVLFGLAVGAKLNHIPYAGEQAAITDVIGGRVPMMFANAPTALLHMKAGKVKGLAVASPNRVDFAPDLPTVAEGGLKNFDASTWLGIVAPKGTSVSVVEKLNAEVRRALAMPEVRQKLEEQGYQVADMSPVQFGQLVREEDAKWEKVLRDGNIKAD